MEKQWENDKWVRLTQNLYPQCFLLQDKVIFNAT